MHVSDALVSPAVGIGAGVIALSLVGLASRFVKENPRKDIVPLMGVLGAFVFAAQMINFSIPATGSSGHLIGGILLSAILGPWAAFITLSSIIIIQCLFFADGGLLAIGCNILNMAAASCLVAYPLIYRPIAATSLKSWRIMLAAVLSSVIGLEIGAFGVTLETEFSGVTALPFYMFLKFMLPIHLVIGLIEGIVTGSLLIFIAKYSPSIIIPEKEISVESDYSPNLKSNKKFYIVCGILTLIFAAGFSVLASQNPDGLEWSIDKVGGLAAEEELIPPTAFMPEYNSSFAGIIGSLMVVGVVWGLSSLIFSKIRAK